MYSGIRKVICAISGGVDSCVAALLLKRQGYQVQGVFMRNWDIADESGFCQADKDKEDADYICHKLGINLLEVNFVKEFWNHVFSDFLKDYSNGLTPNPDILCNKQIKFDLFLKYAVNVLKADAVATGHYARIGTTPNNKLLLLSGVDPSKDQTFFLSQIPPEALKKCLFPVGSLLKSEVKRIACEAGFNRIACKKESTGICFIGRRNFQSFIDGYIEQKPGKFVNIENGCAVGEHKGIHYWTYGQRCLIPGQKKAFFVVEKNTTTQEIVVAPGSEHPGLFSQSVTTELPLWITPNPPNSLKTSMFECKFRFHHRDHLVRCLLYEDEASNLHILLEKPLKALTPGQYAVFYKGEECLGSAKILSIGPNMYRLQKAQESIDKKSSTCTLSASN